MHVDHDAVGVARGGRDEQALHQPAIFYGSGFEPRHGAKINQRGIDRLAAVELLHQLDRAAADTAVFDIDHRAVVALDCVFRFKIDRRVRTDDLKIRAKGKDFAVEVMAPYLAANDWNNTPLPNADLAGRGHTADVSRNGEDIAGRKHGFHRTTSWL